MPGLTDPLGIDARHWSLDLVIITGTLEKVGFMEPQILKSGDDAGNRMVAKYTSPDGLVVYGIGVPQTWETPLGPTWSYVIEGDKLTLVDTGCNGSVQYLEEGLEWIGYPLSAVGRVIVTHGHMDHDGNCFQVMARSGAELWAHEVYTKLVGLARWQMETDWRRGFRGFPTIEDSAFVARIKEHEELGRRLKVTKVVTDGLATNGLTFYYTPGHSPDELCILFHRLLFSGDHILPQITPHPSISRSYQRFRDILPEGYQADNRCYGLKAYLKSLKKVSTLGDDISVMPAHRAFHDGKFNPIGLQRAREIVEHHRARCHDLIDLVRGGLNDLEGLTRKHFSGLALDSQTYYMAFGEVISHIEFLQETRDVEMVGDDGRLVQWNGTEHFSTFIDNL